MNDYAAYSRQHIPRIFRSILDHVSEHDSPLSLDEASKNLLENIFQVCNEHVISDYRSQLASNASNSMMSMSSDSIMTPFPSILDEMQLEYSMTSSASWSMDTESPSNSQDWTAADPGAAETEVFFPTWEQCDFSPNDYP
jgi:hypothetical protein